MTNEELVVVSRGGDAKATDSALAQLIEQSMGLIRMNAYRYASPRVSIDDLLQEGALGVIVAAQRFDPSKDVTFSTYAGHWIRAYIIDAARQDVTHNNRQRRIFNHLGRAKRALLALGVLEPSDAQIAEELGEPVEHVTAVLTALSSKHEPPTGFVDESPSPEDQLVAATENRRVMFALNDALGQLDRRERYVVLRHYLSEEKTALEVIGSELGISRERVRQIKLRALTKVREHMTNELAAA